MFVQVTSRVQDPFITITIIVIIMVSPRVCPFCLPLLLCLLAVVHGFMLIRLVYCLLLTCLLPCCCCQSHHKSWVYVNTYCKPFGAPADQLDVRDWWHLDGTVNALHEYEEGSKGSSTKMDPGGPQWTQEAPRWPQDRPKRP